MPCMIEWVNAIPLLSRNFYLSIGIMYEINQFSNCFCGVSQPVGALTIEDCQSERLTGSEAEVALPVLASIATLQVGSPLSSLYTSDGAAESAEVAS
jgi:hypothetical protein